MNNRIWRPLCKSWLIAVYFTLQLTNFYMKTSTFSWLLYKFSHQSGKDKFIGFSRFISVLFSTFSCNKLSKVLSFLIADMEAFEPKWVNSISNITGVNSLRLWGHHLNSIFIYFIFLDETINWLGSIYLKLPQVSLVRSISDGDDNIHPSQVKTIKLLVSLANLTWASMWAQNGPCWKILTLEKFNLDLYN